MGRRKAKSHFESFHLLNTTKHLLLITLSSVRKAAPFSECHVDGFSFLSLTYEVHVHVLMSPSLSMIF